MLWCCSLGAFGIKFAICLAKFDSQNFASKLAPRWFISDVSGSESEIIGLLIDFSGAASFPRLLSPSLLVTRFINSPSPADKSFGIAVLSLNKALSFNWIKGVLTTILLAGTYIKKVFKLSTVKSRPGSVFGANLWAFRLFFKGDQDLTRSSYNLITA